MILVIITAIKNKRLFVFFSNSLDYYLSISRFLSEGESFENIIKIYALTQNHNPIDVIAKPSFGNIILWKVIYHMMTHTTLML